MWAVIFLTSSEWASVFLISPHFSPQDPLYYFCLIPSLPFVLLSVSVSWLENKLLSSFVVGVFVEGAERKLGQEQNKRQLLHLPWLNFTPQYSATAHTWTQNSLCISQCLLQSISHYTITQTNLIKMTVINRSTQTCENPIINHSPQGASSPLLHSLVIILCGKFCLLATLAKLL